MELSVTKIFKLNNVLMRLVTKTTSLSLRCARLTLYRFTYLLRGAPDPTSSQPLLVCVTMDVYR